MRRAERRRGNLGRVVLHPELSDGDMRSEDEAGDVLPDAGAVVPAAALPAPPAMAAVPAAAAYPEALMDADDAEDSSS